MKKFLPVYIEIVIFKVHRGRGGPYIKSFYKVKFKHCVFKNKLTDTDKIGGYQRRRGWGRAK